MNTKNVIKDPVVTKNLPEETIEKPTVLLTEQFPEAISPLIKSFGINDLWNIRNQKRNTAIY